MKKQRRGNLLPKATKCRAAVARLRFYQKGKYSAARANLREYRASLNQRIRAFSGAPRSDVINVVLCRRAYHNPAAARQSVLLPQNGSHPRILFNSRTPYQTKRTPVFGCSFCLAQRRGFEPPVSFQPTHDFQSCSLNHSDISAIFIRL